MVQTPHVHMNISSYLNGTKAFRLFLYSWKFRNSGCSKRSTQWGATPIFPPKGAQKSKNSIITWISYHQSIDNSLMSSRKSFQPHWIKNWPKNVCPNMGIRTLFLNGTNVIWFVLVNYVFSVTYSLIHVKLPRLWPTTSKNGQNWPYLRSRFCISVLHYLHNNFCIFKLFSWNFQNQCKTKFLLYSTISEFLIFGGKILEFGRQINCTASWTKLS